MADAQAATSPSTERPSFGMAASAPVMLATATALVWFR